MNQLAATAHKGDPCIYCSVPHDDVPPGPCSARRCLETHWCVGVNGHENRCLSAEEARSLPVVRAAQLFTGPSGANRE